MKQLHKLGLVKNIAKSILPIAASSAGVLKMHGLLRYGEIGLEISQGKGFGFGWDMESESHAAASCIRRPNPVLGDIGAIYGKWAQGLVRLFPAAQKVVLFEPQEECLVQLRKLDLPGKLIVSSAVSDYAGVHSFYVGPKGWGGASLYDREETFFSDVQQHLIDVSMTTLDEVIDREGFQFIDFIKFDIEGAELPALQGAVHVFSRNLVGAISLEFGSGNINSRTFFRDFWGLLTAYGFEILRILPGGRTLNIGQYYEDLEHFRGVSNYLARKTGVDFPGIVS